MFLNGALAVLALAALPRRLLGGVWPVRAFASTTAGEALIELLGTDRSTPTDQITLLTPIVAEDGSVVPITVKTSLPDPRSINLVVNNNPRPLVVSFDLSEFSIPEVDFRIKMARTSQVLAVVVTEQGIFSTSNEVKVTVGGC
jgi:sulfur-oxidizing protein SoxY